MSLSFTSRAAAVQRVSESRAGHTLVLVYNLCGETPIWKARTKFLGKKQIGEDDMDLIMSGNTIIFRVAISFNWKKWNVYHAGHLTAAWDFIF